jgi:hypothetical protein
MPGGPSTERACAYYGDAKWRATSQLRRDHGGDRKFQEVATGKHVWQTVLDLTGRKPPADFMQKTNLYLYFDFRFI